MTLVTAFQSFLRLFCDFKWTVVKYYIYSINYKNVVMKKRLLLSLFSFLSVVLFAQNSYTIKFNKEDFFYEEKDSVLLISTKMPDAYYSDNNEEPALPCFSYRILRPSASLDYKINVKKELLFKNVKLESNPYISSNNSKEEYRTQPVASMSINSPIIYADTLNRYGYCYTYFKITPFEYDVKTGNLYFVSAITITYDDDKAIIAQSNYQSERGQLVKELVINPDEMDYFYPVKSIHKLSSPAKSSGSRYFGLFDVDYLIITRDSLKSSFDNLIHWKRRKGLKARLVTVEYIDSLFANFYTTTQARIKAYIHTRTSDGLKWVLLAGDESVVPVQYCQVKGRDDGAVYTDTVPSDLYYSTFNNYSYIVEDEVVTDFEVKMGFEPMVYLTRIPIHDSYDAMILTEKILAYEKGYPFFNPSYVNKMLFAGASYYDNHSGYNNAYYHDENAYNLYISPYWSGQRDYLYCTAVNQYQTNLTQYNTLTPENLCNLLNSCYHFFHMDCHGSLNSWDLTGSSFQYTNMSPYDLTNSNRTIIATTSCMVGAFDKGNSLCEYMLNRKNGALAFYSSSRDGFHYTNTQIGQSLLYDSYFFKSLFTDSPSDAPYHFGSVAAQSKLLLADNAHSSESDGFRYLQIAINPLGDPEMPIYTSYPSDFSNVQIKSDSNGNVTVTTGGVGNCTITLMSYDDGETYYEVAEGVSSYTFTDVNCLYYITVTKHNYRPYLSNLKCPDITGDSYIWTSRTYSINLPSYYTVTWSLTGAPSSVSLYSYSNSCVVTNYNTEYVNATLTATIRYDGFLVGISNKNITTGGDFCLNVHQQGKPSGGTVPYPTLDETIYENGHTGVFETCTVTLTSPDLSDAQFTFAGFAPSTWTKNADGTITTIFPSFSGTSAQTAIITGKNNTTEKFFRFYIHVQPGSILNPNSQNLNIYSSNGWYTFSLNEEENREISQEWDLKVLNATTGNTVYYNKVKDSSVTVDATEWKPGIYVVQGKVNNEVFTKKISVK